jgi:branched-chain amino acid transport system permease protein
MNAAVWADIANLAAIYAIYAVSVNLIVGWAGIPAVVPTAFGAVGGYLAAWLIVSHHWPTPWAALAGLVAGGLVGLILSGPSLLLSVEYVILLTVAAAYVIVGVFQNIPDFGGPGGLFVPALTVAGEHLHGVNSYLPWLIGVAVLAYLFVRWLGDSPFGIVLKGIREDELAVGASGFNTVSARTVAFTISAALSGLAGALYVFYIAVASPGVFGFAEGILVVTMVIIGGLGRPFGPIIGAVLIELTPRLLQNLGGISAATSAELQQIIFGLLLVTVIILRPAGLLPEIPSPLVRRYVKRRGWTPGAGSAGQALDLSQAERPRAVEPDAIAVASRAKESGHDVTADDGAATAPVLVAKVLRKRFGGLVVADGFDFDLPAGQIVGLVGPNGAGKTTLFNLLTGVIRPDEGSVFLFGRNITGRRIDQIVGYGMARSFQDVRLIPRLTVLENVFLGAVEPRTTSLRRMMLTPRAVRRETEAALDRAAAVLRIISMEHKSLELGSALSFGEQKLVALARAIATGAEVLLLDEPAAGVGTDIARRIVALIKSLGSEGKTLLLVEHNLEFVRDMATSVYFLADGGIKAHGTYDELTADPELARSYFGTMAERSRDSGKPASHPGSPAKGLS